TEDVTVRNGDVVDFAEAGYVLQYGFDDWRLQPVTPIDDATPAGDKATFTAENTRPEAAPEVGGDVQVAAFNVFNYFTTMSEDDSQARGAKNEEFFEVQRSKIVSAIDGLDAEVVALMEIENSVHFGDGTADVALADLVEGLNEDAGSDVWDFVPMPDALLETDTDVITNAIIYQKDAVTPVGDSMAKIDESVWGNAREPIAQAFDMDGKVVSVVANHFKSKSGDGDEPADGQGHFNEARTAQAESLLDFTGEIEEASGSSDVLLLGDFNAYSREDPINVFDEAGWTDLVPAHAPGQHTYTFDGELGSLDHAIASPSLAASVTGTDVWTINSPEWSDRGYAFGASEAGTPFRSSDHDPVIVGISSEIPPVDIDIVTVNDFHGRIEADGAAAGAAVLAGAVQSMRDANPNTIFAANGDSIGASTFTSFIDSDNPTIDALNAAGLEVSSMGNHEFDQGWEDLRDRVQPRADWPYLGANVFLKDTDEHAGEAYFVKEVDGVKVGFIGAVTEDLPTLVSPEGIADIDIRDITDSVNAVTDDLTDGEEGNGEADVIVLLVHEGAATTDAADITVDSPLGEILDGLDERVDAVSTSHTHQVYNHVIDGRPVFQAGQYGERFALTSLSVDPDTKELLSISNEIMPLTKSEEDPATGDTIYTPLYDADPDVQAIVDAAKELADVLGAEPVGEITGDFNRARQSDGTENRGGESVIGNFVADVHKWATGADIAMMNPGGIRANLTYAANGEGDPDGNVTFREAATVQPFANTLVTLNLTGAQVKAVLEEQWQPAEASRPFLKLGLSEGLQYTYDPTAGAGERITSIMLDGEPIDPEATYVVAANSFLAGGGDNFSTLAEGTDTADTGKVDLQSTVDWFDENGTASPDLAQRAVGATLSAPDADGYSAGDEVTLDLSSLAFSGGDPAPGEVTISLGETELAAGSVDPAIVDTTDEAGRASLTFTVPDGVYGEQQLTVAVADAGTSVQVPITFTEAPAADGTITLGASTVAAGGTVTIEGSGFDAGAELVVELRSTPVQIGTAQVADDGSFTATVTIPKDTPTGAHTLAVILPDGSEATAPLTVTAADGSGNDGDDGSGDEGAGGGAGDAGGSGDGDLATTGADPTPYLILAALLLVLGSAFVVARRRSRTEQQ
ncbi:MAG: ExeM/NucH family extracellular endonuclease, partial [Microbacteriaceae bacterium]